MDEHGYFTPFQLAVTRQAIVFICIFSPLLQIKRNELAVDSWLFFSLSKPRPSLLVADY